MKNHKTNKIYRAIFIFSGLASLIWFLIRVIPKPSRAEYPCQRAAFPIASAFVIWIVSSITSITIFKNIRSYFKNYKYSTAFIILLIGVVAGITSLVSQPAINGMANTFAETAIEPVNRYADNVLEELPANVAVVKASKTAFDLTYNEVESLVNDAVSKAGGLDDIIDNNDVVVLKPNLIKPPSSSSIEFNGVVTNKHVLKAVAKMVRQLNPDGQILVMEGTAGNSTSDYFTDCGYRDITEIDEFIAFEEASGNWREYSSSKLTSVNLPDSISLYPDSRKPNNSRALYFNKRYFDADVIISLPCLKNHFQSEVTGAVKNIAQGCTPANIYGVKSKFDDTKHNWRNIRNDHLDHGSENIHHWLHDFYAARPVDFSIMDGLQGVEKGPAGGRSGNNLKNTQKDMRLILASKDAVAMDAIASLIMTHDPQKVNYLIYLHNNKKGIVDPALIDVTGTQIPGVRKTFSLTNAQSGIGVSLFTNPTIKSYTANAGYSGNNLSLRVTNSDANLARVTLWFDSDLKKKYVVGSFSNAIIPLNGLNITSGTLNLKYEDIYLNSYSGQLELGMPTSINEELADVELRIYPNPVKDVLTLDKIPEIATQIIIRTLDGKTLLVKDTYNTNNEIDLDISDFANGLYIITIYNESTVIFQDRIIKQ